MKVILPAGMSGIVTGALLAVARGAGETAPLLFTAFGSPFMAVNIFKPMGVPAPDHLRTTPRARIPNWQPSHGERRSCCSVIVLALNIVTKLVTSRWKIQF